MWRVLPLRCARAARCTRPPSGRVLLDPARSLSTREELQATPEVGALAASEFSQLLHAVGISRATLPQLYVQDQNGEWVSESPSTFPVAIALSGGADSMALMLLLNEFLNENRVRTPLLAITVDHKLRLESSNEARHVGRIASQRWGVVHKIMTCDWDSDSGRNGAPRKSKLQEQARSYRYELLVQACQEHNSKVLFVAHNLGDQIETVLFRLGRASGINGLAGIAPTTHLHHGGFEAKSVALLRPLLEVPKTSLKATCKRFGQDWVEDPSNESLAFDRIRIRKAIEQTQRDDGLSNCSEAVAILQQIAAEAKNQFEKREEELLKQHMKQWKHDHLILSSAFLTDSRSFDELRVRILSRLVCQISTKTSPPRLASVETLLHDLRSLGSGKKVTLSGCQITRRKRGREFHFQPEQIKGTRRD